ncbi:WAP four-disulfide core domain protein 2 isoform X1 [Zootoca vivipara]|uniref:WAP four-disulfide core domain protein 2 isoform X1 n=1 Tax=Zootoca vivipara TaxID=8524 RepID=UPI00293B9324|nr:WAP four-disulfide core domain protein 2 isoform X1 [Zootoca vivipara]
MTLPAGCNMKLVLTVFVLLLGLNLELFGPNPPSASASPLPETISQVAAAVKGGTCPDTEVQSASSNCTEECQSDASCEGVEKCCRTGCGASCHLPNDKPGTCPSLSIGISMLGACHNACEVDSNCPGDKKCCQNGCGKLACSTPEF